MRQMLTAFVCAAVLLPGAARAQEAVTTYKVTGTGLNGSAYKGTAAITRTKERCRVSWRTPDAFEGFCFEFEKLLTVAYTSGSQKGLVIYSIEPDGTLKGVWNVDGVAGSGTEILTPNSVSGGSGGASNAGNRVKAGVGASQQ